jgi:hypothetical protein
LVFKKLFGGGDRAPAPDEISTIEDLIVLERYEEAVERLKHRLRGNTEDLHGHLRLAEAYAGLEEFAKAADEFVFVAEEYAQDGFHDRGIALLVKAKRFLPLDAGLDERIEQLRLAKDSERARSLALEGLREGRSSGATAALQVERLWHHVAPSALARNVTPEQLKLLFSAMDLVSLEADEILAKSGSTEARLYFLLRGVVSARARVRGRDTGLRDFGPGDVIGESVLLERGSWPADYRVTEPGRALVLTREGLEKALVGNPDPRGLLNALRMQHHDQDVLTNLRRLNG